MQQTFLRALRRMFPSTVVHEQLGRCNSRRWTYKVNNVGLHSGTMERVTRGPDNLTAANQDGGLLSLCLYWVSCMHTHVSPGSATAISAHTRS